MARGREDWTRLAWARSAIADHGGDPRGSTDGALAGATHVASYLADGVLERSIRAIRGAIISASFVVTPVPVRPAEDQPCSARAGNISHDASWRPNRPLCPVCQASFVTDLQCRI